jgi:hypothetical protein
MLYSRDPVLRRISIDNLFPVKAKLLRYLVGPKRRRLSPNIVTSTPYASPVLGGNGHGM